MTSIPTASRLAAALLVAASSALHAQSVLEAPANLAGAWVAAPGVLQFDFLHRFTTAPAPTRKVSNAPTFTLALGVAERLTLGATYASNSQLVPVFPNEWELFARGVLVRRGAVPFDVFAQAGYNAAARSADAALTAKRQIGRLQLVEAVHVVSNAWDSGRTRVAAGGGATVRLTSHLALAGDAMRLLDRRAGEAVAWSAGIQLAIPQTPHTLSLHATNVNSRTVHGVLRGSGTVRYGFEFTVPLTLGRFFGSAASGTSRMETMEGPKVSLDIVQVAYARRSVEVRRGTTVTWRNRDPLAHTVTADSGAFDSGLIQPDGTWSHTFDTPGVFTYHCTPHPFMTATIVVR